MVTHWRPRLHLRAVSARGRHELVPLRSRDACMAWLLRNFRPVRRAHVTLGLVVVMIVSSSGCVRSVTLRPEELSQLRIYSRSAHAVYSDGHTLDVKRFDRLVLYNQASGIHTRHAPLQGELDADTLRLDNERGANAYWRDSIREIELSAAAPARPWIVIASAIGGALLVGGIAGGVTAAVDRCSGELCAIGPAFASSLGGIAGLLLGVGLGLHFSSDLAHPQPPAPAPSTASSP